MPHLSSDFQTKFYRLPSVFLFITLHIVAAEGKPVERALGVDANSLLASGLESPSVDTKKTHQEVSDQVDRRQRILYLYRSKLLKKVYVNIIYPAIAIDLNWEGNVMLQVTVDRQGRVTQTRFDSKSKYEALNKAALHAVTQSTPFYTIPEELTGEQFEFTLPIKFRLTG